MGYSPRKRKAEPQLHGRASQRQRPQAKPRELKDEAYIRQRAHVPTAADYPDMPAQIFNDLKGSLKNAVQDVMELRSDFKTIGIEGFTCELQYEGHDFKERTIGEGKTKVSDIHAPSSDQQLTLSL